MTGKTTPGPLITPGQTKSVPPQNSYQLPIIAIIGRPNVGKSTLFNRLLGKRRAIVQDIPGVTRDRHYAEAKLDQKRVLLIDTGGIAVSEEDPLWANVRAQSLLAVEEADAILFVVDGKEGFLPDDQEIWNDLRKSEKPSFLVINKIDGPSQDPLALEFYRLGVSSIFPVSAAHGRQIDELIEAIEETFPDAPPALPPEETRPEGGPVRVAIVGRPNVGKSSLINRLLGEERLVVSDLPGTTRDAIDSHVTASGREYIFIDTAGIRRKRSIYETVEKMGVAKSLKSLDRCDVAVLLLDGEGGVAEQDAKIAGFAHEKGRAVVLAVNKWDLGQKQPAARRRYEELIAHKLHWLSYASHVYLSAKTGQGVGRLLSSIQDAYASYLCRIPTGELNRVLEKALDKHQPPTFRGHRLKIQYAAQIDAAPPTFLFHVNYPEGVHFSYQRYLQNTLRETFGFEGTPLKLLFRKRKEKNP